MLRNVVISLVRDAAILGTPELLTLVVVLAAGYAYLRWSPRASILLVVAGTAAGSPLAGAAAVFLSVAAVFAVLERSTAVGVYVVGWALALSIVVAVSRLSFGQASLGEAAAGLVLGGAWAVLWWRVLLAVDPAARKAQREASPS